jgi:hypothetical protein
MLCSYKDEHLVKVGEFLFREVYKIIYRVHFSLFLGDLYPFSALSSKGDGFYPSPHIRVWG